MPTSRDLKTYYRILHIDSTVRYWIVASLRPGGPPVEAPRGPFDKLEDAEAALEALRA